ncbi:hypothetical protein [Paenibacillus sp. R14(2021)]|uniref:hypothetical protein n=1 Tax=Paenibacillus sp. R14(2021) TaxID=2859228 RepID=UPI001C615632|nr:hypothetical protein [Paenibacillus sp. R14(2021)]
MGKLSLVLAVKEGDYIERLADYIRHSSFGESWQLTAFTNPAALRSFVRGGYSIDLLAAQPDMLAELGELPGPIPSAALVGRLGGSGSQPEVLQFQPLPQLLQAFTSVHAASGQAVYRPILNRHETAVLAIYSASGGVGKTTLALQIAQQASIAGAGVFYLNLEQWNAASFVDGEGGRDDFARLLYSLQSEPEKGPATVKAIRRKHPALGIDGISPSGNPDERLSLGAEQVKQLLNAIAGTGEYGCIVVDLDTRLDAMHAGVFGASHSILWLLSPDEASLRKNGLALKYGEQKYGAAFEEQKPKFCFVQIGGAGHERILYEEIEARDVTVLPYVEEWASGGSLSGLGAMAPHYRGAVESLSRKLGILRGTGA